MVKGKGLRNGESKGRSGQSTTEFILMLAILSTIGIYLMKTMDGPHGDTGVINNMTVNGVQAIQNDKD